MSKTQVPERNATTSTQEPSATPQEQRPATANISPESAFGAVAKNRGVLGAGGMLALQAAAGNRAVAALFGGAVQRAVTPDAGPAAEDAAVHAAASRGVATPATTLPYVDTIQRSFGHHDVSSIRAHVGGEAAAASRAMDAGAYATGDHVVFGRVPDLHTAAHEAAHVVQQRGGVQLKGGVGRSGDAYEQHADAVADAVVAGRSAAPLLDQYTGGAAGGAGVQHTIDHNGTILGTGDIDALMVLLAPSGIADNAESRVAAQELLAQDLPISLSEAVQVVRAQLDGHGGGAPRAGGGSGEGGGSAAAASVTASATPSGMGPSSLAPGPHPSASSLVSSSTAAASSGGAAINPIERIQVTDFTRLKPVPIGNSRGKLVYFFNANGDDSKNKADAAFIVDCEMDDREVANYREVQSRGLRAPKVFGKTTKGPIVEWIQDQLTVDVAKFGGVQAIRRQMLLDPINKKPFATARWKRALSELGKLVAIGYTSRDLQFMVDENGLVYLMDLEADGVGRNVPEFRGVGHPDQRLLGICSFLEESITKGAAADVPVVSARPAGSPMSVGAGRGGTRHMGMGRDPGASSRAAMTTTTAAPPLSSTSASAAAASPSGGSSPMLAPVPTPKASVAEVVVAATQPQPQRQPTAQLASDPSGATTEPTDQPKAANPTVLWPRFR